jgi:hypothetical protein
MGRLPRKAKGGIGGMRFIKKGLVVEAYQWTPDLANKNPSFNWDTKSFWILLDGEKKKIGRGDWIVTGLTGKKKIVKEADFDILY